MPLHPERGKSLTGGRTPQSKEVTIMSNQQKVAIVTGASQGIGAGIVRAYRDAGYAVVANSRNIKTGSDDGVIAVPGNIGDRTVAQSVVATAVERFGRIDTLINNAGIFIGKPFTEYTAEDFNNVIEVNVAGFFHITQLALAQMLKQSRGHIVQITTALVDQPLSDVPSGLATLTKGGLDAVTRGLAIEYAKKGIRVNAVAPGIIKTPMHSPETHEFLGNLHPVGRMGEIRDVVDAVVYLERAAFVTGETLNIDGGQHAGR
jgi:NAD(P)-dependent dehydrogenase (short-subunit alcohol dehydrogenase family)